ncbi:MAG: insulinase family protein, partial [Gudongella sp.]|nr:insulinase family protein [Gudongella sp.]
MILESKRTEIRRGIWLNVIETDKFKTNLLTVNILRPLDRDEVTMNALLPMVLDRGTSNTPTKLMIERKLEEMYGSVMGIGTSKRGERQIISASIEWADSIFIEDATIGDKAVKLLRELLFEPLAVDGAFNSEYVAQEKKNLISRIKNRINDKRTYAVNRCIEEMCKGERFSIYNLGYEEDAANISEHDLFNHYERILEESPIEIFYVGRTSSLDLDKLVPETQKRSETIIEIPRETIYSHNLSRNQVVERLPVTQGKLVLGYRSSIPYEDPLYDGLLLGTLVLGGGPNSYMFMKVREEESLAYYASASVIKHKSIILAEAGIEIANYNKTLDLMIKQMDRIKEGDFTQDDIEIAKKSITTSTEAIIDSNRMITDFNMGKLIAGDKRSLEEIIKSLEAVTKEEIVKAMSSVSLDTIYFMKDQEGG